MTVKFKEGTGELLWGSLAGERTKTLKDFIGPIIKAISFYVHESLEVENDILSQLIFTDMKIVEILVAVGVAPVGEDIILNISKNGGSLYGNIDDQPKILDGETTTLCALPEICQLNRGDILSLSVEQIGTTEAGAKLSLVVLCEV